MWQKFGKPKNQITVTQIQKELKTASSGGGPNPNDDDDNWRKPKVNNMYEFFETEFGRKIKSSTQKTKIRSGGNSVNRVTTRANYKKAIYSI